MTIEARLLTPLSVEVSKLDLALAPKALWRGALEDYAEALQELAANRFAHSMPEAPAILARAAELVLLELDGRALYQVRAVTREGVSHVQFREDWLASRVDNPAARIEGVLSMPVVWVNEELRILRTFGARASLKRRRAAERSRNRNPRAI